MNRLSNALIIGAAFTAFICASAGKVCAALGGSADSVETDRKVLSAAPAAITVRNGYTVHEVKSDANTVREYISASGVVFAIGWNGLAPPDLEPLLGTYADEYRQALRKTARKPGQRHLQVKADRVVVEQWGHMRNLQGRAFVPALIPPGVSNDEIR